MNRWYLAVLVCVALNMLDGFDVLVISIVSPAAAAEWHLSGQQLGELFSVGIAGMVLGSIGLAPLADQWGRRRLVIVCILLVILGMGLSGASGTYRQLAAYRFLTGLGIGGILASAVVLVSEHAPEKWKTTATVDPMFNSHSSVGLDPGPHER